MRLNTERMQGFGDYLVDGYQVNYLFGLNQICERYINKDSIILELGTNDGVSTQLFSEFAKKVVAVDIQKTAEMNLLIQNSNNIEFHQMSFNDFFKNNTQQFDFIYIDGNHDYESVLEDIRNSLRSIKENGIISGHDFNSTCPGVIKSVQELFGTNIEVFSDSSWVFKK